MKYSIYYGIFHWIVHLVLSAGLVLLSGFNVFSNSLLFNVIFVFLFSSLIDLDHISKLRKLGAKDVIKAEKIIPDPLHNFFILFVFSALSAISAIFFSRIAAVLLLSIALHISWDFFEDIAIFKIDAQRWSHVYKTYDSEIEKLAKQLKRGRS